MFSNLWNFLKILFSTKPYVPNNNTWDYKVNRIIKSKYENGDYEILHPVLHHYLFIIDGMPLRLSIVEVHSAIDALTEFEEKQNRR